MTLVRVDIATLGAHHEVILVASEEGHAGGVEIKDARWNIGIFAKADVLARRAQHVQTPRAHRSIRAQCDGVVRILRTYYQHRIYWLRVGHCCESAPLHWCTFIASANAKNQQ